MKRSTLTAAFGLMLATLAGGFTPATASPGEITYQGRLQTSGGAYSGSADIRYALFTTETGGDPLARRMHTGAAVVEGVFTTALDFGSLLPPGDAWLEISLRTPAGRGAFTTITPRQKLTGAPSATWSSTPWSYNPANDTVTVSSFIPGANVLLSQRLGINTTPVYPLDIAGDSSGVVARFRSGNVGTIAVDAQSTGSGGVAVRGIGGSAGFGGFFTGRTFTDQLLVGTQTPVGTMTVVSPGGVGLRVIDQQDSGGQSWAIWASTPNPAGNAIYAESAVTTTAVIQANHFGSGVALSGYLAGTGGVAVYGLTPQPASNWAGFFNGRMGASGTKSFAIDHPLNPADKVLMHYCSEGPEPLNFYQGTVVTDAAGFATVDLPDYFGAINTDLRYQLTVVDESDEFVLAKVAHRVENNRFVIRTSVGNVEVSWQVSGVRSDAFVRAYGAPVEMDKPEDKRGTFLAPELYHGPAMMEARTPAPSSQTGAVR